MSELFICLIEGNTDQKSWTKDYTVINGGFSEAVCFKIDFAEANLLPLDVAKQLYAEVLPSTTGLVSYTKHKINSAGHRKLKLQPMRKKTC